MGTTNGDGMTTTYLIPSAVADLYEVHEWRDAAGVLSTANYAEWNDIIEVLSAFRLYKDEVIKAGGRKSPIANRIDSSFFAKGWKETKFQTAILVDGQSFPSPTHLVDCFKGRVALEVEWNNKDPFYDRDLNNFRLLFDLRVIDVGVIVTRCSELQDIFDDLGKGSSYGSSTTHMTKLLPRIEGGGGGGCPILAFGISKKLFVTDPPSPTPSAPQTQRPRDDDDSE